MTIAEFNGTFEATDTTNVRDLIVGIMHVEPILDEHYDMLRLDPDERVQVRIDKNNAPREMVERFVHQMSFSQFPPVVVTQDAKIVDGNTRVKAHWERETRFGPALVVPIDFEGADADTRNRLLLLGRILNNSNGKPLDREERKQMVRTAVTLGMSQQQMTGTIGFRPATIRAVQREMDGEDALERVGLDKNLLKPGALGALGGFAQLHDEPLRALAELAAEANYGSQELKALAVEVARAGSDQNALLQVEHAREADAQRIEDVRRGGAGKPAQSKQLRQRLGFIAARDPEVMVERNPEEAQDHLRAIRQAIEILTRTLEVQERLAGEPR